MCQDLKVDDGTEKVDEDPSQDASEEELADDEGLGNLLVVFKLYLRDQILSLWRDLHYHREAIWDALELF